MNKFINYQLIVSLGQAYHASAWVWYECHVIGIEVDHDTPSRLQ